MATKEQDASNKVAQDMVGVWRVILNGQMTEEHYPNQDAALAAYNLVRQAPSKAEADTEKAAAKAKKAKAKAKKAKKDAADAIEKQAVDDTPAWKSSFDTRWPQDQ